MKRYEITYTSEYTGCSETEVVTAGTLFEAVKKFEKLVQKDWDIIECLDTFDKSAEEKTLEL
jgi:hypothetical protein